MDNSNFTYLEQKVVDAIDLIKSLRSRNSQLSQERDDLATRCELMETETERMNHELEDLRLKAAEAERFEGKRRAIEEKVGGLLEKLEAIG